MCRTMISSLWNIELFCLILRDQIDLHRKRGVSEVISFVHGHSTSAAFAWQLLNQLKIVYLWELYHIHPSPVIPRKTACEKSESVEIYSARDAKLCALTLIIIRAGRQPSLSAAAVFSTRLLLVVIVGRW